MMEARTDMAAWAIMIGYAALAVLIAYLLGSIPTGYLIARRVKGVDIREVGDRYTGAKNVFREIGVAAGIATAGLDVAKGAVAMLLTRLLPLPEVAVVLVALAVVSGHIWPVFLQFRGGAGLATALGAILVMLPREALILLIPFLALALLMRGRLGLGLTCGLLLVPLILLSWWLGEPPQLVALPVVVGVLLTYRVYGEQIGKAFQRAVPERGKEGPPSEQKTQPRTKAKTARHLYHLAAGCILPFLALLLSREWLLLFVGTVTAIFVLLEALRFMVAPFNRWLISLFSGLSRGFKEREAVRPIGTTYFLVASLITFVFFPRDVAIAALFFAAVGDAMAAEFGERFGRRKLGRKSLEGTAAFFLSALGVGYILLWAGLQLSWAAVAAGALVAALVELLPIPLNDNLTVPVVSAAAIFLAL